MRTDVQNWTEDDLVAATKEQLDRAAELVGGRAWGADKGKPRIYMPSRRDCKVWFEFEDYPTGDVDDLLGGAGLRISIDDCGQHPNWYRGQRAKIMSEHTEAAEKLAAARRPADADLHGQPVTRDQAAAWRIGETVTLYYGGAAGEDNSERSYTGTITRHYTEPDQAGTLNPDPDGLTLYVWLDEAPDAPIGQSGIVFYSWRGLLRYGGGAEQVRD